MVPQAPWSFICTSTSQILIWSASSSFGVHAAQLAQEAGSTVVGVRPGVKLPDGVTGHFAQYLDDYFDPKNEEFTRSVWWEYMKDALQSGQLRLVPTRELGGLSQLQTP